MSPDKNKKRVKWGLTSISGLIAALFASLGAMGAYLQEVHRIRADQIQIALPWARQIAAQAEILILYGQEKREKDPMAWATHILSLGDPSKPIQVNLYHDLASKRVAEAYQLNLKSWGFEYTKMLKPETGTGIKVHIQLHYIGFLGASTPLLNDLMFFMLFYYYFF